jgi:hypothetical protein
MVAVSLSQLAFLVVALVVLIGVPLLVIPFVRRGPKDDLARPLKFLNWGFWLTILSFALAMVAQRFFPATDARSVLPTLVANLLLAVFYVFAWVYWTSLAVLVHRRGRSAAIWVTLGLVTLAIGFLATYILMASHVRTVLKTQAAMP